MRFPPILVLVFLPICCVCQSASATAEEVEPIPGQHDVIAPLLEKRGPGGPTFPGNALHAPYAVSGASRAFGPILIGGGSCNPSVRSIRAWNEKKWEMEYYGGEEAYEVPWSIYEMPAVVKRVVTNSEAERIVTRRWIAILDRVKQLEGWSVVRRGEKEIFLVVQTKKGVSVELGLKNNQLKHIAARARKWYARQFDVRLPYNVRGDMTRYRFIDRGHEIKARGAAGKRRKNELEAEESRKWTGLIVGWKGGQSIHELPTLHARPRHIFLQKDERDSKDILVLAWNKKGKPILYGGKEAYPFQYHQTPAVIRGIVVNNEADDVAARHHIANSELVRQHIDWVILHQGEHEIWLVAQTWWGVPARDAKIIDKNLNDEKLKIIQESARHIYSSVFGLKLPEHVADRFTYIETEKGTWIGQVVWWEGVESTGAQPVLRMEPEIICDV